jgi:hypothetical protein
VEAVAKLRAPKGQGKADLNVSEIERWVGVHSQDDPGAVVGLIHLRVDELIYGDFPLLLLDVLGRLRMFNDAVTALHESVQERPDMLRPVYSRLKPKRASAKATTTADGKALEIEFQSFQAEQGASIELVLGLSRPLRNFEALKRSPPDLRFFQGDKLVERPYLGFDAELSTETMLVYRIPKPDIGVGRIGVGTFTPKLILPFDYLPVLGRDNVLDYTFSIATPRPNVQLITALRQPQPKEANRDRAADPDEAFRGTLAADQLTAVVEVQVLAGASIQGAEVTGVFQRFDKADDPIDTPTLTFLDDGIYPDLQANDGVYTRSIPLVPNVRRKPGEYRIFIQANSTEKSMFIPVSEPIPVDPANEDKDKDGKIDPDKDPNKDLPKLPAFQRSTSLNFHVSGES